MSYAEMLNSGLGAIVGFTLAQIFNFSVLFSKWIKRPKLKLEMPDDDFRILSHVTQTENGEHLREEVFAISLANYGASVSTNVRVQLTKIEIRDKDSPHLSTVSEDAFGLATYSSFGRNSQSALITLAPGTKAQIRLGGWREDYDAFFPSITGQLPEYYEDACRDAVEYRLTIVAIDDQSRFVIRSVSVYPNRKN